MKKQTGFSLIEMMIAMLLGILVTGSVISIYISTIRGSSNTVRSARLNHDLDGTLQLMMNDIRRAGYWAGAVTDVDLRNNPPTNDEGNWFTMGSANVSIPQADCILYSYDSDESGIPDNGEFFGFKQDGDVIKIRTSDAADLSGDCTGSGWVTFTDEDKIKVSTLTFDTLSYKCVNTTASTSYNTPCADVSAANLPSGSEAIELRQINIVIEGEDLRDGNVEKKLTGIVKVRNNRIFTQQP